MTNITYSPSGHAYWTRSYGVHRWGLLASSHGRYGVITSNYEFDMMRNVSVWDVNVICVVDDFGNLVRVPE